MSEGLLDTLREYADWADGEIWNVPITLPDVLREAADLLEKHVPPCKLGDPVYVIRRTKYGWKVAQGTVSQMYYDEDMRLGIMGKGCGGGYIGKDVFLTKEDAERTLEKGMKHGQTDNKKF